MGRREERGAAGEEEGGREGERASMKGELPSHIPPKLVSERQGKDVMAAELEGRQGEGRRGGRRRRGENPTDENIQVGVAPVGVGREEVVCEEEAEGGLESGRTHEKGRRGGKERR